jgi:hypothetical protein
MPISGDTFGCVIVGHANDCARHQIGVIHEQQWITLQLAVRSGERVDQQHLVDQRAAIAALIQALLLEQSPQARTRWPSPPKAAGSSL